MVRQAVIVKALFPHIDSCSICGNTQMCAYHDREVGWICDLCIEHDMEADYWLNNWGLQLRRPRVE